MYDNLIYKSSIEEGLLLFAGPLLFFCKDGPETE